MVESGLNNKPKSLIIECLAVFWSDFSISLSTILQNTFYLWLFKTSQGISNFKLDVKMKQIFSSG